jgi:mRNA-degrading endonuclease YafQ of YafQ-DinJ toxin-antitoxin module
LRFTNLSETPHHSLLNYHALSGKLEGTYSINVSGDYRAQFFYKSGEQLVFLHIGTHSQLYG